MGGDVFVSLSEREIIFVKSGIRTVKKVYTVKKKNPNKLICAGVFVKVSLLSLLLQQSVFLNITPSFLQHNWKYVELHHL